MNLIKVPNIPDGPVGLVIIDGRVSEEIEDALAAGGTNIIRTCAYEGVYDAISHHPDIMLHHLGEEYIVYAPGISSSVLEELEGMGFVLIKGEKPLGLKYPDNIAYNAARVGKVVFHNFKHIDPVLKKEFLKRGLKLINVRQGYSKCSISIVNEEAIITADRGIARAAEENGIEVLLIAEDENIILPGLDYGFIGGSTGLINKNKWAAAGNIHNLKSFDRINGFLETHNIEGVSLSDWRIIDVGSIIPLALK